MKDRLINVFGLFCGGKKKIVGTLSSSNKPVWSYFTQSSNTVKYNNKAKESKTRHTGGRIIRYYSGRENKLLLTKFHVIEQLASCAQLISGTYLLNLILT